MCMHVIMKGGWDSWNINSILCAKFIYSIYVHLCRIDMATKW